MTPLILPAGYSRIKRVKSFDELASTRFGNGVNALCWERTLTGDFEEVVQNLTAKNDIDELTGELLRSLPLSPRGKAAVDTLVADLENLHTLGLSPVLDCIHRYPKDKDGGPVPTDVYSFHADSATAEADTWLCSYTESASEGLRNEDALRCVDIPEIRANLLAKFGGADGEEFRDYLNENCYDLHYVPVPHAQPFSFGLGNLWRIATEYPGSPVPPCVHRAPATIPGRPPRLLLIS